MLDLLWIKINERFRTIAESYRYFDVNFNNRVSFNEFQKGLDHLRIKFQVNIVDAMFKYLDQGQKGYISYQDFCELAEEKRRNIDAFDYEEQQRAHKEHENGLSWIEKYISNADLSDLELMSKRANAKNINKTTPETQALAPKTSPIPKRLLEDPNFRFGNPSGQANVAETALKMKHIVNHEHMKENYGKAITRKAIEELIKRKQVTKDWRNNVFKLRSQSVAKQIEERNKTFDNEIMQINKGGEQQGVSDYSTQASIKRTKLPPLSALDTYPKQSQGSIQDKKRSSTSMRERPHLDGDLASVKVDSVKTGGPGIANKEIEIDDPFYHNQDIILQNTKTLNIRGPDATMESLTPGPGKTIKAKNALNGKLAQVTEEEVLNHIHNLRLQSFEKRTSEQMNEKPYLPMLSSDEKELIMEDYFASKKKLNKKI